MAAAAGSESPKIDDTIQGYREEFFKSESLPSDLQSAIDEEDIFKAAAIVSLMAERVDTSSLYMAFEVGAYQVIDLLVEMGAALSDSEQPTILKVDEHHNTLLHLAISEGEADRALALIQLGANINAENRDGDTPLSLAARLNQSPIVNYLLMLGAAAPAASPRSAQEGVVSSTAGDSGAVSAEPVAEETVDLSPLAKALQEGQYRKVVELLAKGESLSASEQAAIERVDENGDPLLHFLIKTNAEEQALALMKLGVADVNQVNKDGHTPLFLELKKFESSKVPRYNVINKLLEAGAVLSEQEQDLLRLELDSSTIDFLERRRIQWMRGRQQKPLFRKPAVPSSERSSAQAGAALSVSAGSSSGSSLGEPGSRAAKSSLDELVGHPKLGKQTAAALSKMLGLPTRVSGSAGEDSASPVAVVSGSAEEDSASPVAVVSGSAGEDSASPVAVVSGSAEEDSASPVAVVSGSAEEDSALPVATDSELAKEGAAASPAVESEVVPPIEGAAASPRSAQEGVVSSTAGDSGAVSAEPVKDGHTPLFLELKKFESSKAPRYNVINKLLEAGAVLSEQEQDLLRLELDSSTIDFLERRRSQWMRGRQQEPLFRKPAAPSSERSSAQAGAALSVSAGSSLGEPGSRAAKSSLDELVGHPKLGKQTAATLSKMLGLPTRGSGSAGEDSASPVAAELAVAGGVVPPSESAAAPVASPRSAEEGSLLATGSESAKEGAADSPVFVMDSGVIMKYSGASLDAEALDAAARSATALARAKGLLDCRVGFSRLKLAGLSVRTGRPSHSRAHRAIKNFRHPESSRGFKRREAERRMYPKLPFNVVYATERTSGAGRLACIGPKNGC